MNKIQYFFVVCLFVFAQTTMAGIYKCKTADGIVYSQIPCATNAEKITNIKSKSTVRSKSGASDDSSSASNATSSNQGQSINVPTADSGDQVDIKLFGGYDFYSPEEILKKVGPPAARYTLYDTDYWLYPNAVDNTNGVRACPELLLRDNVKFQITWIPEDIMKRNVAVAKSFANWRPSGNIVNKIFSVVGVDYRGLNKSALVAKLGEPDGKKAYNGSEWWEYKKVLLQKSDPARYTLYISFEGNKVSSSAVN